MSAAWRDSFDAAIRRIVRDGIRKGPFTKSQRDVTLALVNLWFHHKGGDGFIHPGRKKLAKRSGVHVKTVSRTLDILRECGAIVTISNLRGGYGKSTRYVVDIWKLLDFCGVKLPEVISGHLVAINVPQGFPEMSHKVRDKMSHGNNYVRYDEKGKALKPSLKVVGGLSCQPLEFAEKGKN